ncbi:unnamed protein product [Rotaria socialis]|uniref:Uncharacterized protein n=1 Tax=Rotaria socialis TaxID=392032 RepID=A0A817Y8N4_9BILA|nr:unnamed protein product [Rotaria socialis]
MNTLYIELVNDSAQLGGLINKFQSNRRQLAATLSNQYHLPNRHVFMKRTMAHLHEKSNLLHERLTDKKKIDYVKEHQHELK